MKKVLFGALSAVFLLGFAGVVSADITIDGVTTDSKVYDGTTDATVDFGSAALVGDTADCPTATLNFSAYTASFDTKHVGIGKTVTVSGLTLNDPGTCVLVQPTLADGEIILRPLSVTAQSDSKIYDGLNSSAVAPVTSAPLAVGDVGSFSQIYDSQNVGAGKILTPSGTIVDAGAVDVTSNYDITFVNDLTGEITPALLTITADDEVRNYGDVNPTFTAEYDGFVNGETEAVLDTPVLLSTLANGATVVGSYEITASGATDSNYLISHVHGALTINARPITVTADAKSKTYGALDPALTHQITTGSLVNGDAFTGSLTRAIGENVGSYAISQGTLALTPNYNLSFVGAYHTINPAPLSITANSDSRSYDGLAYSGGNGVVFSGFVNAENQSALGGAAVYGGDSQGAVGAGSYLIVPSGYTSSNYDITFNSGTLTVNKANAVISVPNITVTYDGNSHGVTGTATGAAGENLNGLLSLGSTFRNVPGGTANWTFAGDANHNSSSGSASVTINPRAITIRGAADTKVYDGTVTSSATPNITAGSLGAGDTANFSQAYATKDVGGPTKTMRPALSSSVNDGNSGNNYSITRLDGAFGTITAKPLTTTVAASDKVYDGSTSATITSRSLNGVVAGETITVNGGVATFADANVGNNKTVSVTGMTLGGVGTGNYSFAGTATTDADITSMPITVTANSLVKAFGSPDPALTHNGVLVGTDSFTGALTRAPGESVGTYAITQGTLSAGSNYNMTFVPGTLTISDQNAPVITLNGDSSMSVWSYNPFVDPGAVVIDDVDGVLVATVTGSVNTSLPGTYTLTYTASDSTGHEAVPVVRTVTVVLSTGGSGGRGRSSGAASLQAAQSVARVGVSLPPQAARVITGEVLGAATSVENEAKIAEVKTQIQSLISQLISLLQAQLAAAIKAGNQ